MTKEEFIQFLRENLRVTTDKNDYTSSVRVSLWLDDEELSCDWIDLA